MTGPDKLEVKSIGATTKIPSLFKGGCWGT